MAQGRMAVLYHHNTRFPGGHALEVAMWQERLGPDTIAVRANAYSCRTFFVVNADQAMVEKARTFSNRWSAHKVSFVAKLG